MIDALQSTAADPEVALPSLAAAGDQVDQAFPTLNEAQIARIAAHGRARKVERGEVLVKAGARNASFFVVVSGNLEIVRLSDGVETLIVVHKPGQVSGELNVLSGRRAVFSIRAGEAGEVIELDRDQLLAIIQTDAELSEILMRAFLLRRVELIAQRHRRRRADRLKHSPDTLRIQEFLTRNGHPYQYIDLDRDAGVQDLLDRFHFAVAEIPVVICRGEVVLRNPSNREIADCLGFNDADRPDAHARRRHRRRRPVGSRRGGVRAHRKVWMFWCSNRMRRADRPGRARESRTTSAFPPASRVRS